MGCKYVSDFEFPADKGFSASAGKTVVKGYMRGAPTKSEAPSAPPKTAVPAPKTRR